MMATGGLDFCRGVLETDVGFSWTAVVKVGIQLSTITSFHLYGSFSCIFIGYYTIRLCFGQTVCPSSILLEDVSCVLDCYDLAFPAPCVLLSIAQSAVYWVILLFLALHLIGLLIPQECMETKGLSMLYYTLVMLLKTAVCIHFDSLVLLIHVGRRRVLHLSYIEQSVTGCIECLGDIYAQPSLFSSKLNPTHQRVVFILMSVVVSLYIAGDDCWLIWGLPSFLLSLLLITQFTLVMELLAPFLCWYQVIQDYRDEVKGNYPLAYEDGFSEAKLANFLLSDWFFAVCWQGTWRLLRVQTCGNEVQIGRIHIQAQDFRDYYRGNGSLNKNGMIFQCIFSLILYQMMFRNSPIVKYVTAIWAHVYIKDLRMLFFVYIAHLIGVPGPCLMALVWQANLPRNVSWIIYQDPSSILASWNSLFRMWFIDSSIGGNLTCLVIRLMLEDNELNIVA